MSTKQLLVTPVNAVPKADLKALTRQMLDIANKRYKRGVEKWGEGALPEWTPGKSLKGLSEKELKLEYQKAQHFLKMQTTTEKGRQDVKKKFEEFYGIDKSLTIKEYQAIQSAFNKVGELHGNGMIDTAGVSYDTIYKKIIEQITTGKTIDGTVKAVADTIERKYEELQIQREKEEKFNDFILQHPELRKDIRRMSDEEKRRFIIAAGEDPAKYGY